MSKRKNKALVLFLTVLLALSSFGFSALAQQDSSSVATKTEKFIVVFKSESLPSNYKEVIQAAGGEVTYEVAKIGTVEASTSNPTAFIKTLLKDRNVISLAPSIELPLNLPEVEGSEVVESSKEASAIINNIWESGYQWDIEKVTNNGASHAIESGSKDVVVGVIDTGFDFNHPDLKNNIVSGSKTFVPGTTDAWDAHSHGTHVAGTIGANGSMKGIAPNVGLRAYRVFNTGGAQQVWITNAIVAAADDGVDVINMSLGGTRVVGQWYYTDPATGEKIRLGGEAADMVAYNRAVRYAVNKNVTVVASAGNDAQDLSNPAKLADWYNAYLHRLGLTAYEVQGAAFKVPAQTPGVITVSATGGGFGTEDRLAFFSNYGNGAVELAAPGGDLGPDYPNSSADKFLILSTVPTYLANVSPRAKRAESLFGKGYGWKAGTSMASPQVAGVAAAYISKVFKETGKKPTPSQVQTHLQQTAVDAGKVGYDANYGHGIVNAFNAVK
ncbi:S8 family serine peptidase [Bacillus pinisoli]|uniref:S8 family serine peptidase n=1 Tax=Bacillus pinisoli TaxID=2901866 RepID=UPI001FF13A4A|nr:S8 family serine peptidase [Bacillus pinisoli]